MPVEILAEMSTANCPDCLDQKEAVLSYLDAYRRRIIPILKSSGVASERIAGSESYLCRLECGAEFVLFPNSVCSRITDWRC